MPSERKWGDIASGNDGAVEDGETFDNENDRVLEVEGRVTPDSESEGDFDIGVNGEGEAIISSLLLLLGIGI